MGLSLFICVVLFHIRTDFAMGRPQEVLPNIQRMHRLGIIINQNRPYGLNRDISRGRKTVLLYSTTRRHINMKILDFFPARYTKT